MTCCHSGRACESYVRVRTRKKRFNFLITLFFVEGKKGLKNKNKTKLKTKHRYFINTSWSRWDFCALTDVLSLKIFIYVFKHECCRRMRCVNLRFQQALKKKISVDFCFKVWPACSADSLCEHLRFLQALVRYNLRESPYDAIAIWIFCSYFDFFCKIIL